MTGIAGDNVHPVNNAAGVSQHIFFSCITILDLTVCIMKYILSIAKNIPCECKTGKRGHSIPIFN